MGLESAFPIGVGLVSGIDWLPGTPDIWRRVNQANKSTAPVRFDDLPLSEEAREGLRALGYELATAVQAAVLAPALAGEDLMVQSKTGTGKTTAFGLPVIERIRTDAQQIDPQAVILCPTRELAIQVAEELAELGDPKGVRVLPIYGGAAMGPQLKILKAGCDVVVGTPGRVLDHIRRRTLRLVHVHIGVLDEADEMLSMGFWEDVTAILEKLPAERQTFLFSATLPDAIRKTALNYMKEPKNIDISRDELTVEGIRNVVYETDDRLPKPRNLLYVLEVERPENAIIFCNTRDDTNIVAAFLRRQGLNALALSGELAQKDRERIMQRMKRGDLQYLVATDIASRGIDISDLSHVVNYALPEFTEVYVHRVGRTGRVGKKGTAISLVSGRDELTFTELVRTFQIKFEKRSLPDNNEITRLQAARVTAELLKEAREVEITASLPLAECLREAEGSQEVIAFLLKRYFQQLEEERAQGLAEIAGVRERPGSRAASRVAPDRGQTRSRSRSRSMTRKDRPGTDVGGRDDKTERIRLFVSRGVSDGYREDQVRRLVLEATGMTNEEAAVTRIQLRRTHSFAEVSGEAAKRAIQASDAGIEREEKPVTIERARTRG